MSELETSELTNIPSHWQVSTMANETEFITDYVANGSFASLAENVNYKSDPDYAVLIRLTDFNNNYKGDFVYVDKNAYDFLKKSKLVGGEIIISNVGAYAGTVFLAPNLNRPMTLGPNSIMMNFKNGNTFYYYWLKSPMGKFLLEGIISGSAQPKFNKTTFRQMQVPVPPLPEQTAIASVLSSLDDKIDLLHRQNATLEKMAETLFRQWFVEEAKEEWEVDYLSFFADFFNGKSRPNEEGTVPIYGGNGILGYANKSNYSGKSIIIGRVGAYCGSLYYENKEIWVSDNALLLKSKHHNMTHFLFYLLKTLDLNSMAEGSSHPLLTQTLLKSIEIQIPPIQKINEFDGIVEDIQSKIESNQTQIRTLTAMRDSLLPKLMSGEVKVKSEE